MDPLASDKDTASTSSSDSESEHEAVWWSDHEDHDDDDTDTDNIPHPHPQQQPVHVAAVDRRSVWRDYEELCAVPDDDTSPPPTSPTPPSPPPTAPHVIHPSLHFTRAETTERHLRYGVDVCNFPYAPVRPRRGEFRSPVTAIDLAGKTGAVCPERDVVRAAVEALLGYPNEVFEVEDHVFVLSFTAAHLAVSTKLSPTALHALLRWFAAVASNVLFCRRFASQENITTSTSGPLLAALRASLRTTALEVLAAVDRELAGWAVRTAPHTHTDASAFAAATPAATLLALYCRLTALRWPSSFESLRAQIATATAAAPSTSVAANGVVQAQLAVHRWRFTTTAHAPPAAAVAVPVTAAEVAVAAGDAAAGPGGGELAMFVRRQGLALPLAAVRGTSLGLDTRVDFVLGRGGSGGGPVAMYTASAPRLRGHTTIAAASTVPPAAPRNYLSNCDDFRDLLDKHQSRDDADDVSADLALPPHVAEPGVLAEVADLIPCGAQLNIMVSLPLVRAVAARDAAALRFVHHECKFMAHVNFLVDIYLLRDQDIFGPLRDEIMHDQSSFAAADGPGFPARPRPDAAGGAFGALRAAALCETLSHRVVQRAAAAGLQDNPHCRFSASFALTHRGASDTTTPTSTSTSTPTPAAMSFVRRLALEAHYAQPLGGAGPLSSACLARYGDVLAHLLALAAARWAADSAWMASMRLAHAFVPPKASSGAAAAGAGSADRHVRAKCRAGLSLLVHALSALQTYYMRAVHGHILPQYVPPKDTADTPVAAAAAAAFATCTSVAELSRRHRRMVDAVWAVVGLERGRAQHAFHVGFAAAAAVRNALCMMRWLAGDAPEDHERVLRYRCDAAAVAAELRQAATLFDAFRAAVRAFAVALADAVQDTAAATPPSATSDQYVGVTYDAKANVQALLDDLIGL